VLDLIEGIWESLELTLTAIASAGWRTFVGALMGAAAAAAIYVLASGDPWRVWMMLAALVIGVVVGLATEPKGRKVEY
jgi:uncharacterized membrane protein